MQRAGGRDAACWRRGCSVLDWGGWVTAGGSDLDEKMQEFGPSGIILLIFGGKIIGI